MSSDSCVALRSILIHQISNSMSPRRLSSSVYNTSTNCFHTSLDTVILSPPRPKDSANFPRAKDLVHCSSSHYIHLGTETPALTILYALLVLLIRHTTPH